MDNFALFGHPRQPWIEPAALKARFLELSAAQHPDRFHSAGPGERDRATGRYAELNAAYNCLREPKDRLAHLLELESGAPPANVQNIPPDAMDLFAEIGRVCREADRIIAALTAASSPLVKAQWFAPSLEMIDTLNDWQRRIQLRRDELLAESRTMNSAWNSAPPPGSPGRAAALPLRRLEEIYRVLSYTNRWTSQLRERVAQLSF